ncbi:microcephalin [Sceloporus undulatus]|uniref:microcephalin n=1 Tax=Sceloporus undulatus TaxID=8520 RepID=UPI001C4CFE6E|nr:microcephalin [Sceloporus undulatus]
MSEHEIFLDRVEQTVQKNRPCLSGQVPNTGTDMEKCDTSEQKDQGSFCDFGDIESSLTFLSDDEDQQQEQLFHYLGTAEEKVIWLTIANLALADWIKCVKQIIHKEMLLQGAKVSKNFNKQVTHVVFKDGFSSTWKRAQKAGIKLVSVLWVEKCREIGAHVDESLYPAKNSNEGLPPFVKKHKCMQPKDFIEKTPENNKKLQKRLEIMTRELAVQKATVEADTPVLVFEDNGSLAYSPASKIKYQCSAMERRIKDMKEKRENLSPTASQMSQVSYSSSGPALHEQIPFSTSATCELSPGDSHDLLSLANLLENVDTENAVKDSNELMSEGDSATDISIASLWSSPLSTADFKHRSLEQPNGEHLRKKLIAPNGLKDKYHVEKARCDMSFAQKHVERNGCFTTLIGNHLSPAKNLDYSVSSMIHLKVTEETGSNHLNLEVNLPSIKPIDSSSKEQKKPRRRSTLTRSTSSLPKRDSHDDFLQAMLHPVGTIKNQDTSFEDYFSPSNVNKSKRRISLPFSCLDKLQSPGEMVCKYSLSKSKTEKVLKGPSEISAGCNRKRKRMSEINETPASRDCTLSPMPQNKGSPTLNYMSKKQKGDTMEADSLLNLSVQEKMTLDRCSPKTGGDSVSNVKDDSCDLLHDPVNEPNRKVKNTKEMKPLRTLVMTSMSPEKQNVVVQVVKKLGGFLISDEVCKSTSHVIAGSPRRTLNVLMGIAHGCWIICYEWVLWSLEYSHWISEEPCELSVDFPAAPICRFQRYLPNKKDHQKLFSDQPMMFISHTSQPPCKKLCELVELCGGKVCKTIRQAKICIGKCRVGKYTDVQCLSEKWILDSITQHKICPMENYIFPKRV